MSGKICTKVYNLFRVSNFTNKEISVILRVQNFPNLGQFHKIHETLNVRNLIPLTYYSNPMFSAHYEIKILTLSPV